MTKEQENEILRLALKKHLKREPTEEDGKNCTRKFYDGYAKPNYDFYYKNILLGRVKKNTIFGKEQIKFKPSK